MLNVLQGKDDLRQDAVMQQVFNVANMLLQQDADSRKKNFKMRTYKVRYLYVSVQTTAVLLISSPLYILFSIILVQVR